MFIFKETRFEAVGMILPQACKAPELDIRRGMYGPFLLKIPFDGYWSLGVIEPLDGYKTQMLFFEKQICF